MKCEIRKIEHAYGVEYILEKKEKKKFIFYVLLIISLYYVYYLYTGLYKEDYIIINEPQILLFVAYISFIIIYLNNYKIEKLLLISNVGIQIEKKYRFYNQLNFFCLSKIKSVFINEAIYILEICPYLCLILKNNKIIVLFEDFNLDMQTLVNIYRMIKKVIFFSDKILLGNIKTLDRVEDNNKNEKSENKKQETYDIKEQEVFLSSDYTQKTDTSTSSEENNIFKLLNSNSNDDLKISDSTSEFSQNKTYDVYINKKLAFEIMNDL
ncbi:phosphatidylinositol N-acetylglucosaminyltransferase subunit H, putative [Hepatocystis sp. ex Piliocolobus tephrosceles]|nr:phosphatidylinositol N-acetylglucosaminyltransferase subunit H, putative [Hepatocystis sp. ex Piliocolobus tephrosceles]